MNNKQIVIGVVLALASAAALSQTKKNTVPSAADIAGFKKLAAQSVLHAEVSLKKISQAGPTADTLALRREVVQPVQELQKRWAGGGYSDRIMMEYSACTSLLDALPVYAAEARRPPGFHLGDFAQKKLRDINEDLSGCRKLQATAPAFNL